MVESGMGSKVGRIRIEGGSGQRRRRVNRRRVGSGLKAGSKMRARRGGSSWDGCQFGEMAESVESGSN